MNLEFERMTEDYAKEVMDIFNYYVENSFSAYPESKLPYEFYGKLLEMINNYPAYVIKDKDSGKVAGFCFLRAHNPFPVFKETAELSCFLEKDEVGKGIGKKALCILEEDAKRVGIKTLLVNISSENAQSINFHQKNGFKECGRFSMIGKKMGRHFDVIWMQKDIINGCIPDSV